MTDATQVKNAGILFFAKDVYQHIHHAQMTLLAFKGTEKLHIYDRRDVRDDLLIQFNEAVVFLQKHLNVRSEIIADMYYRLHKVERVGMGIKRMRKVMREAGLRAPEFEIDSFFRAVFHRPEGAAAQSIQTTTQKTTQKTTQNTAQKIIALIAQKPDVTRQQLAEEIGITDSGVKYYMKRMREQGLISRVDPDKGGHWEVVG